ncbi:hypothetical protein [Staphylococcus equorum]|uniref:hypothetical protein n=2 Tax=Staphylococcus equorum TaxID=246432 RepID=UPI00085330D1|nr:hypothetical protein [Staphylococcus equorum]OEK51069.1 hypothetical protein ASS97_13985 [Staphylococcus equorum]
MGLFKEISDQDKLLARLKSSTKEFYIKYDDKRKEEILNLFKVSKDRAINQILEDKRIFEEKIEAEAKEKFEQEQKLKEQEKEEERLKNYEEELKNTEIADSLKIKGLNNLTPLTEDLVKRANFPNDMMNISNFITQFSNIGNPTNMHMLNMSQTNVNQNFVFIKLLDEIKEENSKIIEQNKEIIKLLKIISEK